MNSKRHTRYRQAGLAAAVFAVCLAAHAEPRIVALDAIADQVGQEVSVVAEVKAVSGSPRSGAKYLNFGDAYPRQSLSAKLDAEQAGILKKFPNLLSRTIKLTGVVEQSSTGPQIMVRDASQIELQPVEAGDVLEETAGGARYMARLGALVDEWLADGKYDDLDAVADKWRREKTRTRSGAWNLTLFYQAFAIPRGAPEKAYETRAGQLEAWAAARPESVTPMILWSLMETDHAWAARGSGFANTVTPDGWTLMKERLASARQRLESVRDRREDCPHWYAAMQTVALGQGWSREEFDALCDEAIESEPAYLEYYFRRAYWLTPRWYGKKGEWEKMSRDLPGEFGIEMRARITSNLSEMSGNIFRDSTMTWPEVDEGFRLLRKKYPLAPNLSSAHAFLAGMAGERQACGELLDGLGDDVDMNIWVSWINVELARKWAADPDMPPPVNLRLLTE